MIHCATLFSSALLPPHSHLAVARRSDEKDDEAYGHGEEGDDEGGEEPILDGDEGTFYGNRFIRERKYVYY